MSNLSELLHQRAGFEADIARKEKALKLSDVPEFRELILEEFLVKEAARYVQTSVNPALGADERANALAIAQSTGYLKQYLSVIVQMGTHAENQLRSIDEAILEEQQEGDD